MSPITVIEVKYIRATKLKNSSDQHNECDIKNALSQIIEQTLCKTAQNAVLVIINAGRTKTRDWNKQEELFIEMFKKNPFSIHLSIVRVKVDSLRVTYKVI